MKPFPRTNLQRHNDVSQFLKRTCLLGYLPIIFIFSQMIDRSLVSTRLWRSPESMETFSNNHSGCTRKEKAIVIFTNTSRFIRTLVGCMWSIKFWTKTSKTNNAFYVNKNEKKKKNVKKIKLDSSNSTIS